MRLIFPLLAVLVTPWLQGRVCTEVPATETAEDKAVSLYEVTSSYEDETVSEATRPAAPPVDYIGYFFVPFFLIIGVTCNTITVVVMRSPSFRHLPISLVLIALAVSDTFLNLLLPFNKFFVRQILGLDIRSLSDVGCKVFFWAFRTAKMTSSWLVVLISAERFVAVLMPFKAVTINTRKHVRILVASIYLGIGAFNASWVCFADRIINSVCIPNAPEPGLQKLGFAFLVTGLVIYSFIPSVILLVTTGVTVLELARVRLARKQLEEGQKKGKDETGKTTAMLIGVSIAFLVLVLPVSVAHLLSYVKKVNFFESKEKGMVIYREFSVLLEQANYSINFFLYVVCCASFRKQVLLMLGCSQVAGLIRTKSAVDKRSNLGKGGKKLEASVSSVATENSTAAEASAQ